MNAMKIMLSVGGISVLLGTGTFAEMVEGSPSLGCSNGAARGI